MGGGVGRAPTPPPQGPSCAQTGEHDHLSRPLTRDDPQHPAPASSRGLQTHPAWVSSTLARLDKKADEDTYAWEKRWRIHRLLNNDRRVQSVDFAAWDFIRAAMLTRIGAGLGWISEEEACDTLAVINHALQLSYSSWDEAWDAFRTTRWFWAAEGQAQEATNDLHDRHRGEILIGKNGLWTSIPWNAPYPAPRFLILDALAPTKQLSTLSRQKRERSSRWELELDDQTRLRIVPRR